MHYLIDGYNLLFRIAKSRRSLEKKRLELISDLNDAIAPLRIGATLVFDGADEHIAYATRARFDALDIVYTTKALSADEWILDYLEQTAHPSQYTVVSNDRELLGRSKLLQAETLNLNQFMDLLQKKQARKKRAGTRVGTLKASDRELARLLLIFEKRLLEDIQNGLNAES